MTSSPALAASAASSNSTPVSTTLTRTPMSSLSPEANSPPSPLAATYLTYSRAPAASPETYPVTNSPASPPPDTNDSSSPASAPPSETYPGTNSPASPPPATNVTSSPAPAASSPSSSSRPAPSMSPTPPPDGGMSRATLVGVVVGTVLGALLMLIFVGICYKRRKGGRQHGMDNFSAPSPQQPKGKLFLPIILSICVVCILCPIN